MIAVTSSSSITVGTTLNTASRSTDWMPGGPAVDRAGQRAGLPVEMEAQAERVQMLECPPRRGAHRALLHLGEQRVAQFAEHRRSRRAAGHRRSPAPPG